MKENCIKVFTDTEGLYEPNTPVVVGEKKLFKDTESGNTLAQLKLQNVSGKTISSFKLRVTPFDSQRVQLGSATVYEYANLTLADNEECGAKDLFLFHHPDTRFLRVELCYVKYKSGTEWFNPTCDVGKTKTVSVANVYQKAVTFSKNTNKNQKDGDIETAAASFEKLKKRERSKRMILLSVAAVLLCLVVAFVIYLVATPSENGSAAIDDTSVGFPKEFVSEEGLKLRYNTESDSYIVTGVDKYTYTSITIPSVCNGKLVSGVGNRAFYYCTSLESVEIPSSVTSIGDQAFKECKSLASVKIPNSVTSIGESAFHGCTNLVSVTIGTGVTRIGSSAFYGCTRLSYVEIPNSVTRIGSSAFYDCTRLSRITFKGTKAEWDAISKETFWKENTRVTKVNCTDGTVSL